MNFLAHLHLAAATPADWMGSLAPDLMRGADLRSCHAALRPSIEQHRRIDVFTDTHPIFLRSRARLFAAHGRFAGILTDVFYDHLLARDWQNHDERPLDGFVAQVHRAFADHAALMPPTMQTVAVRMRDQRWLESYATVAGVRSVLQRMERRLGARFRRTVRLACATADLPRLDRALTEDFEAFYPLLRARCGADALVCNASRGR